MIEELREHGYSISLGTLYPMLKTLEARGYLSVRAEGPGLRDRRLYRITAEGRRALAEARGSRKPGEKCASCSRKRPEA